MSVTEVRHEGDVGEAEFRYKNIGPGMMTHNYLCAVCREKKAVIYTHTGMLQPCWDCMKLGYKLIKHTWLTRFLLRE